MLEISKISKAYDNFRLDNICLDIRKGEYFVLLGRSGAGKSQLLEIITGLRKADSGKIVLNKRDITSEKIQERKVGMVFQDYAIFTHLTVYENIAYPLKMAGCRNPLIQEKVKSVASAVNIEELLDRKPAGLSGGEMQRVAVARTLITSPDIILLDEPLSSVDTSLKDDIRRFLRKINREGMTILHVTHDYREAIRLADRIGVIHNGKIIQTGTPDEVFSKPVNRFVARFSGVRNFFRVNISVRNGKPQADTGQNLINLPEGDYTGDSLLIVRSNIMSLSKVADNKADNCLKGEMIELNRSEYGYEAYIDAGDTFHVEFSKTIMKEYDLHKGDIVFLHFSNKDVQIL